MRNYCTLLFLFLATQVMAQDFKISGTVHDSLSQPIPGVNVSVYTLPDTSFTTGASSDTTGYFEVDLDSAGQYQILISAIGYGIIQKKFELSENTFEISLGTISMQLDDEMLDAINVKDKIVRVQINGDTVEYNSNAYKLTKSSVLQDLVDRLPGVTFENGQLMSNGEPVTRITIDGKDFFGEDVVLALKNLPADMVDKIQIFNKNEDQESNMGSQEKEMNLVTKEGMKKGIFGNIEAGVGTQDRYQLDGLINLYNKKSRLTLFFMSNNINKQNFDYKDFKEATQQGYKSFYNTYSSSNSGIVTTSAAGLNFNHQFNKKTQLGASYFINNRKIENNQSSEEQYISTDTLDQYYNEASDFDKNVLQQNINTKLEWEKDSTIELEIRAGFQIQNVNEDNSVVGTNKLGQDMKINRITNMLSTEIDNWKFNNEVRFKYKFKKEDRHLRIRFEGNYQNEDGYYNLRSENYYFPQDSADITDQVSDAFSSGGAITGRISYQEPLAKNIDMRLRYSTNYGKNQSDWNTSRLNPVSDAYDIVDSSLTNDFKRNQIKNTPSLGFSFGDTLRLTVGTKAEFSNLMLRQEFQGNKDINNEFFNILPYAYLNYMAGRTSRIGIYYRTSTNLPSTTQLQPIINNINPLFLSTGNPNLNRSYIHTLGTYMRFYNMKTSQSFSAYISYEYNSEYIGTSRFLTDSDTTIQGAQVGDGVQLSIPKNFEQKQGFRYYLNYSIPITAIGFNFRAYFSGQYNKYPNSINGIKNQMSNFYANQKISFSSNFSKNFKINFGGGLAFNITSNSLQSRANSENFRYSGDIGFEWESKFGLHIDTDFTYAYNEGLGSGFNQSQSLLNAEVGYQFLKNNSLEFSVGAYDLLDQNNDISRSVSDVKIRDVSNSALSQFFYVKVTWQFRYFKGKKKDDKKDMKGKGKSR